MFAKLGIAMILPLSSTAPAFAGISGVSGVDLMPRNYAASSVVLPAASTDMRDVPTPRLEYQVSGLSDFQDGLTGGNPAASEGWGAPVGTATAVTEPTPSLAPPPPDAGPGPGPANFRTMPADTSSNERLALIVQLNGTDTGELVVFARSPDGVFWILPEDLERIRLKVEAPFAPGQMLALDDIPGTRYTYDEARQAMVIDAPNSIISMYRVDVGGRNAPLDVASVQRRKGVLLNYLVQGQFAEGEAYAVGALEAVLSTEWGIGGTTATFDSRSNSGKERLVRGDTNWRYIDLASVRSYTAGDFVSNALTWSSSIRMAGFQIASAFDQRSDIVTAALPEISGSAALPSGIDIYINQLKTYSGGVPSGPFSVDRIPFFSNGKLRAVITDQLGNKKEIVQSFYNNPRVLRKGLFNYSLDVGVPRLNYGRNSFDYDSILTGSASARYGLFKTLSLEGHAEFGSDGLVNAGVGTAATLGGIAYVAASVSGSRYHDFNGAKVTLDIETQLPRFKLFGSMQKNFGDYFDLGRASSYRLYEKALSRISGASSGFVNSSFSSAMRTGFSYQPTFDRLSISGNYTRIKTPAQSQETLGLSISRSFGSSLSLYGTGFAGVSGYRQAGGMLTLVFRPTRGISSQVTYNRRGDNGYTTMRVAHNQGREQGSFNWNLMANRYDTGELQGSATGNYRTPFGSIGGMVERSNQSWRGRADIEGSFILANGVHPANKIDHSYVVVRNAGPGTKIRMGGVPVTTSNRDGSALISDVLANRLVKVSIDPVSLPDGWEADRTEDTLAVAYRQGGVVDFGAKYVRSALVVLVDAAGKPLPVGYPVTLNDSAEQFVVGYDGQVYFRGAGLDNKITVDLGNDERCQATFTIDESQKGTTYIASLPCKRGE